MISRDDEMSGERHDWFYKSASQLDGPERVGLEQIRYSFHATPV